MAKLINFQDADAISDMGEFMEYLEKELKRETEQSLPMRQVITVEPSKSIWLCMPVVDFTRDIFLVKLVSEYKKNPKLSLPKATGMTMVAKASTGEVLALLDSNYVTAMRTGALAGLSSKYSSSPDPETLGVIGSGLEALFLTKATLKSRDFKRVKVFSPNSDHRKEFASKARAFGVSAEGAPDSESVVREADVLVVATDSETPVINGSLIKEGCHVLSIGTLPNRKELDRKTIERAGHIIVDRREYVLKEAGDIMSAVSDGTISKEGLIEIEDLISGKLRLNREKGEITIFKSVGFATQDVIAAQYIYEKAVKMNQFAEVDL